MAVIGLDEIGIYTYFPSRFLYLIFRDLYIPNKTHASGNRSFSGSIGASAGLEDRNKDS